MRRIALLILTLLPLLAQKAWAQPFVEIVSTSGGMYACEGMKTDFVAIPLLDGEGHWLVSNPDRLQINGECVTVHSVKEGTQLTLTYEFRLKNGSKRDTTLTIDVRPSTVIAVEQQGARLVPVMRKGQHQLTSYQWRVNGMPSDKYMNVPFEKPQSGLNYSLIVTSQEGCFTVVGFGSHKR